jgi:hypothetical protein
MFKNTCRRLLLVVELTLFLVVALALATTTSSTDRPMGALMTYTWGTSHSSCPVMFIRSFLALNTTRTHLIIFQEAMKENGIDDDGQVCQMSVEQLATNGIFVIRVPYRDINNIEYVASAQYRIIRFAEWLHTEQAAKYHYVGVLDADLFFQSDIFDIIHENSTSSNELHFIAENSAASNQFFTVDRNLATTRCDSFVGLFTTALSKVNFLYSFGRTDRLNMGTMFGTRNAMSSFLYSLGGNFLLHKSCWDQAVMNVLIWTLSIDSNTKITIWGYLRGIVFTIDTGGIRDRLGRFYNEHGGLYAIVHQMKQNRNPFFFRNELARMFPSVSGTFKDPIFEKPFQRVRLLNVLHQPSKVHPIANRMKRDNLLDPGDAHTPIGQSFFNAAHKFEPDYLVPARTAGAKPEIQGAKWQAFAREGFVVDFDKHPHLCCKLLLPCCQESNSLFRDEATGSLRWPKQPTTTS